jgi:hypothetical protein
MIAELPNCGTAELKAVNAKGAKDSRRAPRKITCDTHHTRGIEVDAKMLFP